MAAIFRLCIEDKWRLIVPHNSHTIYSKTVEEATGRFTVVACIDKTSFFGQRQLLNFFTEDKEQN
jgi:hypothetical protein